MLQLNMKPGNEVILGTARASTFKILDIYSGFVIFTLNHGKEQTITECEGYEILPSVKINVKLSRTKSDVVTISFDAPKEIEIVATWFPK